MTNKTVVTFLVLSLCSLGVLLAYVNITPQVDEDFFFSSADPQWRQEKLVSKLFQRKDTQLIICVRGDIKSPAYALKIKKLSEDIRGVPGVSNVVSITQGPSSIRDAIESPFWNRLLIGESKQATNIIAVLDATRSKSAVIPIERMAKQADSKDFKVLISGMPYIARLIQRQLVHDFSTFSLLALAIFSIVILYIFRSPMILLGALVCCLDATVWTLMVTHLLHIPIGMLTANLATVVFVLTISPIVFLTYNWQSYPGLPDGAGRVERTVRVTIVSSFYSTATALLGFLSLLTVPAKPLRELGISGAIGALVAFGTAYAIYPAFLRKARLPKEQAGFVAGTERFAYRHLDRKKNIIPWVLIVAALFVSPGLGLMDRDPSLLSYFRKNSEIAEGLRYIDRNGGSNPLIIVVRAKPSRSLNTAAAYKKLWDLQNALEEHRDVGTVLSLPVLMAQAKRSPWAFFLKFEWLVDILESPRFGSISKSFISEDRQTGLFLLRMQEQGRKQARLKVIKELRQIVEKKGFVAEAIGGTYVLQAHMSKQVTSSLIYGLSNLLFVFFFINWFASGSWKAGFAMTLSFSVIPLTVLGLIGLFRVPLDIVSAPAINVAIGLGIDSAIYTVRYWKWARKGGKSDRQSWEEARGYMWAPVVNAMLVIMMGFAIFLFSQFPPTQRFGVTIISGAFISIFASIFLMPWLAQKMVSLRKG